VRATDRPRPPPASNTGRHVHREPRLARSRVGSLARSNRWSSAWSQATSTGEACSTARRTWESSTHRTKSRRPRCADGPPGWKVTAHPACLGRVRREHRSREGLAGAARRRLRGPARPARAGAVPACRRRVVTISMVAPTHASSRTTRRVARGRPSARRGSPPTPDPARGPSVRPKAPARIEGSL
jgi:hypothetical protein